MAFTAAAAAALAEPGDAASVEALLALAAERPERCNGLARDAEAARVASLLACAAGIATHRAPPAHRLPRDRLAEAAERAALRARPRTAAVLDLLAAAASRAGRHRDALRYMAEAPRVGDPEWAARASRALVAAGEPLHAAVAAQYAGREGREELSPLTRRLVLERPHAHDPALFEFVWDVPLLETLVHAHAAGGDAGVAHQARLVLASPMVVSAAGELRDTAMRRYSRHFSRSFA